MATARHDLFVYNYARLGHRISRDDALDRYRAVGALAADWVGEWNLGTVDRFETCNYEGVAGRRGLIVHNHDWLGMIRATPTLSLQKIYYPLDP